MEEELILLPQRLKIIKCEAHLEDRLPGNPIYFTLFLDSKATEELIIKAVKCRFSCAYIPLQVVDWEEENEFASNGFGLRGIDPLPPRGSIIISVPFNTYVCSQIPYENRWDLAGYIKFDVRGKVFLKSIGVEPAVQNIKLPVADWNTLDHLGKIEKRGVTEI